MKWILLVFLLISCNQDDDMRLFVSSLSNSGETPPPVTVDFRSASFNIYLNFGDATKTAAIDAHVDRVNADVLTLTECNNADYARVQADYPAKGYNYFYRNPSAGTLDLIFCSKYEITYSEVVPVQGARTPIYNEVLIEGKTIGVVSHHNASWCQSNCNTSPSQLPYEPNAQNRCIELYETLNYLEGRVSGVDGLIIQGDWNDDIANPQVETYTATAAGVWTLPAYLSYPLDNAQFPAKPLESFSDNMVLDLSTDLAGSTHTVWEDSPNAAFNFPIRMDYISYTNGLSLVGGEILNSEVDANTGLPKVGEPLAYSDSRTASDHKLVFADFKIL